MKIKRISILFFLSAILWLGNIGLGIRLNYYPYPEELIILTHTALKSDKTTLSNILGPENFNTEQLFPLRSSIQSLAGTKSIWNLRAVNIALLTATFIFFYRFLTEIGFSTISSTLTLSTIIISPYTLSLWMFRPRLCLTIFLVTGWLYLWSVRKTNNTSIVLLVATILFLFYSSLPGLIIGLVIFTPLVLFKLFRLSKTNLPALWTFLLATLLILISITRATIVKQNLDKIPLYNLITPSRLEKEIPERFGNEDILLERVVFPLWFRRMGYNKIYWAYKNATQEVLGFFDLETLFFQEVHPLHQKSEVIFYWPEIFFFISGILWLVKKKFEKEQKTVLLLTGLSLIFYLLIFDDSPAAKHTFTLFALAILIGIGVSQVSKKLVLIVLPLIILWAIWINSYDILKRPLFWYDNRPFVYSQAVSSLKSLLQGQRLQPDEVYISTLVGNPKLYYLYYFSIDPQMLIQNPSLHFTSFNLKKEAVKKNTLYAGFLGEFIGPEPFNNFSEKDLDKLGQMGLQIQNVWKTHDSIAYRYSDYFIIAYSPSQQQ